MGNCDPYSDSPEPVVVKHPQFTRVEEPTFLCNHYKSGFEQVAPCLLVNRVVLQMSGKRLACPTC
jgi:hypothetical protein